MRKFLLLLAGLVFSIAVHAQVISFKTTSFTMTEKTSSGWGKWKPYQNSNLLVTIDLNNDVVTIYSPSTQYYKIISYEGTYVDNDGDQSVRYKFIDQDGDRGTMKLMQRRSGKSEIYIQFSNIIWVYSVIRL